MRIRSSIKNTLDKFFNIDTALTGKGSLEEVDIFLEKTSLSRKELKQLLFQDLSDAEVNAGLSRLFFINDTGEENGHIRIDGDAQSLIAGSNPAEYETYERLVNFEPAKTRPYLPLPEIGSQTGLEICRSRLGDSFPRRRLSRRKGIVL